MWEAGNISFYVGIVLKCQFTAHDGGFVMMDFHIWVILKYVHVFYGILQAIALCDVMNFGWEITGLLYVVLVYRSGTGSLCSKKNCNVAMSAMLCTMMMTYTVTERNIILKRCN